MKRLLFIVRGVDPIWDFSANLPGVHGIAKHPDTFIK
jgi:hypothetical protein